MGGLLNPAIRWFLLLWLVACAACNGKPGPGERVRDWPYNTDVAVFDGKEIFAASGAVLRVPLDGGEAVQLAFPPCLSPPPNIALTATEVIFGDCGTDHNDGTVFAVPRDGGSLRSIAVGQGRPTGFQVVGTTLYWTTTDFDKNLHPIGALKSIDLDGGAPITLLAAADTGFSRAGADGGDTYFAAYSTGQFYGGPTVPGFIGILSADGGVSVLADAGVYDLSGLIQAGPALVYVDLSTFDIDTLDPVSGGISRVRKAPGGLTWLAADEGGGADVSLNCHSSGDEEEGTTTCETWFEDLKTGSAIGYVDTNVQMPTLTDDYVYYVNALALYRIHRLR